MVVQDLEAVEAAAVDRYGQLLMNVVKRPVVVVVVVTELLVVDFHAFAAVVVGWQGDAPSAVCVHKLTVHKHNLNQIFRSNRKYFAVIKLPVVNVLFQGSQHSDS